MEAKLPNKINPWLLDKPVEAIFLDCDGTLSLVEGIDELAAINQVGEAVKAITTRCMSESGLSIEDYTKRLDLVKPTHQQAVDLGTHYLNHVAPDAGRIIRILQQTGKHIYILSSGIKQAIIPFAHALEIPVSHILAVDVVFKSGRYHHFDQNSPLVEQNGKPLMLKNLHKHYANTILMGDGVSDLAAKNTVTRFIGYGGMIEREKVKADADYYIHCPSFYPLLALSLTQEEVNQLPLPYLADYEQAVAMILDGEVTIKEDHYV